MNRQLLDRAVEIKSTELSGRRIALGICGGIAAVETVKVIRELRRYGATIFPYMTRSAARFITPLSVEWAANERVVCEAGPEVEYLQSFDLLLVAPATINTICRCAYGFADNVVSLLAASHLGERKRTVFVPTMNETMAKNPAFEEARRRLESWNCVFYPQDVQESRWKMPEAEKLAAFVVNLLG